MTAQDRGWALVTGAGARLGRAVAIDLAAAGWSVAVHYHGSADGAEETAAAVRSHRVEAVTIRADLSDVAHLEDLMRQAYAAAHGRLEGLVNCAALFEHDVIDTLETARFERQMRLNALAPALLARAFSAALREDAHGAIVNFLDFKLASPYPDHFSYTLSKYALAGATELLARALAPRIRVNAVAPGYVLPAPGQDEARYRALHPETPLKRGPTPEDVAGAARFLLESPAITGQTIYVDAGRRFRSHDRDMAFD